MTSSPEDLQLAEKATAGKLGRWPMNTSQLAALLTRVREEAVASMNADLAEGRRVIAEMVELLNGLEVDLGGLQANEVALEQALEQHNAARARVDALVAESRKHGLGRTPHFTIQDLLAALELQPVAASAETESPT